MNERPNTGVAVRDAATTALLRDGAQGIETLLLRRHGGHVFGANAYVYPGGAVDPADGHASLRERCVAGLGPVRSQLGDQGLAWWMAAIRECFEEAGLLIGARAGCSDPDVHEQVRQALNAQAMDWPTAAQRLDLRFTLDTLTLFAHWTTPVGPPKRYSTRFFVAAAPEGEACCDGRETTRLWWAPPRDALAAQTRGEIELMVPTRATLQTLCEFDSVDAAIAGLGADRTIDA